MFFQTFMGIGSTITNFISMFSFVAEGAELPPSFHEQAVSWLQQLLGLGFLGRHMKYGCLMLRFIMGASNTFLKLIL